MTTAMANAINAIRRIKDTALPVYGVIGFVTARSFDKDAFVVQ
jgi:hypothetical protein